MEKRTDLKGIYLAEGANDEGNAQCTLRTYPDRFLHSDALGWLHFAKTHWTDEKAEGMLDRAIIQVLKGRIAAAASEDPEKYGRVISFCIPNRNRVTGTKDLYKSLVMATPADFDRSIDHLNCPNGVIDLRTGELLPHSSKLKFTHCVNVEYKPNADPKLWVQWLTSMVDGGEETAKWLQIAIGYTLTGHTREEILFYLFGPPRSGKGTFTETLMSLLGKPLAKEVEFGTFTGERSGDTQNFDLAPLRACRFVAASESNQHERFNEAKVKRITGGNEIYCAFKFGQPFNYRPQYKIWLSSNQPVNADPDDDAVWGRVRIVHFPKSFLGEEDKLLKEGMKAPQMLESVLAWAVQGAISWYKLGKKGLPELEASKALKVAQRAELDNVQAWIDESCITSDKEIFTPNAELYQDYRRRCEREGVTPKLQKAFSQSLKKKGYPDTSRRIQEKVYRGFSGLKLHPKIELTNW